jgi:predicted dehydrogenase
METREMAKYRSVILGCGSRSDEHVRPYGQVQEAEVVACCDRNEEQRAAFCERHGLKGYADPVEMIEAEEPDLIHLVTRPSTRVDQLTMVSELGVPACIVEKPIATGVRDWRALCDLADATRTKIGVGAQWRYSPLLANCREVLVSGRLGSRLFTESTAGSTMCDQGVHVLDWITSLNDESPAVRVFGTASGASELDTRHPSPDNTTAQLLFENGVYCAWTLGTTAPRVRHAYEAIPRYSHCRVAVYCERGRVLFEEFGKWGIVGPDGIESGENHSMDDWRANNDAAQAELTRSMFRWLEDDGRPVGTNLRSALGQWNTILGLYASAVEGRPVDLPFDPPDDLFDRLCDSLRARE